MDFRDHILCPWKCCQFFQHSKPTFFTANPGTYCCRQAETHVTNLSNEFRIQLGLLPHIDRIDIIKVAGKFLKEEAPDLTKTFGIFFLYLI